MIFSGELGTFGGHADMDLTSKIDQIRSINPKIEIGWDGGVNEHNAGQLAQAGVDVLNVGGFLQRAEHPDSAYARLESLVQG